MATRLTHIGRGLHARIRDFFDQPPGSDSTPLEVREAVLDDVERRVQPLGRGRRVFPYNRLNLRVALAGVDRPAVEATFRDVETAIRERLTELQAEAPRDLAVLVTVLEEPPSAWAPGRFFEVEYEMVAERPPSPRETSRRPLLHVTVLKGRATTPSYTFAESTVLLGRTAEPADHLGRVRRNRVAFVDAEDGVTETVGRAHARLTFEPGAGEYRLFDDGSRNGTAILREGTVIPVPSQDPRGVRVESGDEIQLGRAVIRISFEWPEEPDRSRT